MLGNRFFKRVSAIINSRDKMRNCQLNVAFFGHCMLGKRFWETVFGRPFVGYRERETAFLENCFWKTVLGNRVWEPLLDNFRVLFPQHRFSKIVFPNRYVPISISFFYKNHCASFGISQSGSSCFEFL